MSALTIVTVTHESSGIISEWLDGLQEVPSDVDIVVVDSGSTDFDALRSCLDQFRLRLVRIDANVGFGAGNNLGARLSGADWLAFVNPDVHVRANDLKAAALVAARHAISCVGLDMVDEAGGPRENSLSLPRPPWAGTARPASQARAEGPVEWTQTVPGCAMVINSGAFHSVGGFDESFFLFMEEIDLHQRLLAAGNRVAVVRGIHGSTAGGQSSTGVSRRWSNTERAASHVRYYRKHFGAVPALIDFASRIARMCFEPGFRPRASSLKQFLAASPLRVMPAARREVLAGASYTLQKFCHDPAEQCSVDPVCLRAPSTPASTL